MATILISAPTTAIPIGRQFERLAEWLRADGHEVTLLTFRESAPIVETPMHRTWPAFEPTGLVDARFLVRLLRELRPDCVVGQMSSINWTMTLGRVFRVPVRLGWYHFLVRAGLMDAGQSKLRLTQRRRTIAYRSATKLVSVSRAGIDELHDLYGIERDRCVVVHNGLEGDDVHPIEYREHADRVVTIGRLVRSKGHDDLIAALAKIPHTVRLTIVGDGPERTNLEALARDLGVGDRIEFAGNINHEHAMAVLRTADVYVHPSVLDNLPGAVMEAMSIGFPIIATSVGSVPELVGDEREALFVPPRDPNTLAQTIARLLSDRELRERLGVAARVRFDAEFEMSHFVRRAGELVLGELARAQER